MLALLLATGWAFDAEGERIAEELLRYANDGRWGGVEDQYTRMIAEHPTMVTDEIHRLGAQSARLEGNLLLSAQRLQRVPSDSPDHAAARADLEVLASTTGLVMLDAGRATLAPVTMPFNPELRRAVQRAIERVSEDGYHVGLLPVGDYTLDGRVVTVRPGFEWQVLTRP
jgi:hypothetical protein